MIDVFKSLNLPLLFFALTIIFPAQAKTNESIFLLGHFSLDGFVYDVTGYYDSLTSKEYAITGSTVGVWIVDVSDPQNLVQASFMSGVPGFDLKVWKNYLYCVTGGGEGQGKIIDISDPLKPEIKASFYSAHNIFISANGYLFAEAPGLKIYNLNPDPLKPDLVWESNTLGGHDATVIDNYVYDFHGGAGTNIYEINYEREFSMELLSTINLSLISYHHSGWVTEDKKYLYICDEGAAHPRPDITVWDITDPANPDLVTQYADSTATIHNLYIINDYAFTSYYSSGFRIFDVSDPKIFRVAAQHDTSPSTGEGFSGAFGCYPFTNSGNIFISDQSGLYVFKFSTGTTDTDNDKNIPAAFELFQNYPNPFNPVTKIKFTIPSSPLLTKERGSLPAAGHGGEVVSLKIYDILGDEISTLINEVKSPGVYEVEFNGENLTSGIYFYNLKYGQQSQSKKLILMK